MDPNRKVPNLNCEVQDLLLEVANLKQEALDLRSTGTPQFNPCSIIACCLVGQLVH